MLLLTWKEKSKLLKLKHKELRNQYFWDEKKFVAVLFFGKNNPSQVYVNLKRKYAEEIWLDFLVFWQWISEYNENFSDLKSFYDKDYTSEEQVKKLIEKLNNDERCVWIICQLPLNEELKPFQKDICNSISPLKDIDWLWNKLQEWAFWWKINFLPATAQSVISLWNAYDLWNFNWKIVSVIWQSEIVWLPISKYLQLQWAEVHKFDIMNTLEEIMNRTKKSDVIISCTWALHLVDENFINNEKNQIIIDVWYWFLDWKSTGDVDFENVKDKIYAISPVPGWVGPMTVACLFWNIFTILAQKKMIDILEK